jgi:hypothetical protein
MSKLIRQSVLVDNRWFGVRVGSVVVSFCERCECQRTHTCVDKSWVGGEWVFVFICDVCQCEGY